MQTKGQFLMAESKWVFLNYSDYFKVVLSSAKGVGVNRQFL